MPRKNVKKVSIKEIDDELEKTTGEAIDVDKAFAEAVERAKALKEHQIGMGDGDSVVELRKSTEKLTMIKLKKKLALPRRKLKPIEF